MLRCLNPQIGDAGGRPNLPQSRIAGRPALATITQSGYYESFVVSAGCYPILRFQTCLQDGDTFFALPDGPHSAAVGQYDPHSALIYLTAECPPVGTMCREGCLSALTGLRGLVFKNDTQRCPEAPS